MATRQVNTKIPAKHNVRRASAQDVTGLNASVIGKAFAAGVAKRSGNARATRRAGPGESAGGEKFQTRYATLARALGDTLLTVDAAMKVKDDPNAKPEDIAAADAALWLINRALPRIAKAADALVRESQDVGADMPEQGVNNQATVPGANVTLAAGRQLMDAAIKRAEAAGAINPQRVVMGLPDTPATEYTITK